jgi:hypothetical protein
MSLSIPTTSKLILNFNNLSIVYLYIERNTCGVSSVQNVNSFDSYQLSSEEFHVEVPLHSLALSEGTSRMSSCTTSFIELVLLKTVRLPLAFSIPLLPPKKDD